MLWLLNAAAALLAILHVVTSQQPYPSLHRRFSSVWDPLLKEWDQPFDVLHRKQLADKAAEMFSHAYSSYMKHGYPSDNVKPKSCRPENVQGGVALTLLDSLDALLIFGQTDDFAAAAALVEHDVQFNSSTRVHVFELTIRALGGLLSAHVATTSQPRLVPGYSGGFLRQARALADRLLTAFDTPSGIPLSWINLASGPIPGDTTATCVACATTLTVEFTLLSRLTGDPRYGAAAAAAVAAVYARRHAGTGLLGNTLSTADGRWQRIDAGIGPGTDSFYEYLLKTYLVFGDEASLAMFAAQYARVQRYMAVPGAWRGTSWVLDVTMNRLDAIKPWVASLSAFWPGLQASVGQHEPAERLMSDFVRALLVYGWLPEQISCHLDQVHPQEVAYPLRPELIESAYVLWSAARAPRYLRIAEGMLGVLSKYNRCDCGYCGVLNITSGELGDTMESFFLAETAKYLFLLLRGAAAVNDFFVFSTEGHLLPPLPADPADPSPPPPAAAAAAARSAAGNQAEEESLEDVAECAELCTETPLAELQEQAHAAQAVFPALFFDPAAAALLRHRRCRACRAVHAALAALPPEPPCDAARRLGITLDQPCPKPPPAAPDVAAAAKFAAAVAVLRKINEQLAAPAAPSGHADRAPVSPEATCGSGTAEATPSSPLGNVQGAGCVADPPMHGLHACQPASHAADTHCSAPPGAKAEANPGAPTSAGTASGEPARSGAVAVAYGLCLLQPHPRADGRLQCSAPTMVPAAGVPLTMLLAIMPPGVMVAQAFIDHATPLRATAAVTLSVAPAADTAGAGGGQPGRALAVLRGTGALFGPVLPMFQAESAAHRSAAVGAGRAGRGGVLTGTDLQHAVMSSQGCASVHVWLRDAALDPARDAENVSASTEHAARGTARGAVQAAAVRGRVVHAKPASACTSLIAPPSSAGSTGSTLPGSPPEKGPYGGAVVVVERGGCMFAEKVLHAEAAGAAAVIVLNTPGRAHSSGGDSGSGACSCSSAGAADAEEAAPDRCSVTAADADESDTLDVFLMQAPAAGGAGSAAAPGIPAAMLSAADGRTLTAAIACMQGVHACSASDAAQGHAADTSAGCTRYDVYAELASAANLPTVAEADEGTADAAAADNLVPYDVSWRIVSHASLVEDIAQMEEEVGVTSGTGWEHALTAASNALLPLIEPWLAEHPEVTVH
eukprot:jgi/Ulvmu1/9620/UM054_0050.1